MARCEDCIHHECCVRFAGARTLLCGEKADERCKRFKPTAEVVPKSEVNEIIGTFEVLLYKHYNGDITEREFYRLFAELKKKYREG